MHMLPMGIQSFETIRRDDYQYVDKTAFVYKLAHQGKPYFLSRPQGFGKSLLVSTLRAYFEGKRELFEGLEIEGLEGTGKGAWQEHPVFHMSFDVGSYTHERALDTMLGALLKEWEDKWAVPRCDGTFGHRFCRLLELAHVRSGHRCVVLVDECDKPLLECMYDPALEERNSSTLMGFLGALKDADEHLRFVLVASVTRPCLTSVFGGLDQLNDISLCREFAAVCGITEFELQATFGSELDAMAKERGWSHDETIAQLRERYGGYRFHPKGPAVHNPLSLLKALHERDLGSYWFQSGMPAFVVERMRKAGIEARRLVEGRIYATDWRLFDVRADDPDPVPLLYQAGYLTLRGHDAPTGEYELGVPNGEVEYGLLQSLLPTYAPGYSEARGTDVLTLRRLVEVGDTEGIRRVFAALFASIPYTQENDPFENYFQTVIWLVFTLLGRYVSCEVHQATGRVDCVVEATEHVYVFEFKRDGTAAEALAQIVEKGYAAPYEADSRTVHLIGCAFDATTRTLKDWEER